MTPPWYFIVPLLAVERNMLHETTNEAPLPLRWHQRTWNTAEQRYKSSQRHQALWSSYPITHLSKSTMTSWSEHTFRITCLLWWESTGQQWFPSQRVSNPELWCFFAVSLNKLLNKQSTRHCHVSRLSLTGRTHEILLGWVSQCGPPVVSLEAVVSIQHSDSMIQAFK